MILLKDDKVEKPIGKWQLAIGNWQLAKGKGQRANCKGQIAKGKLQMANYKWQITNQQKSTNIEVWRAFRSRKRITIISKGILWEEAGTFGWKVTTMTNKVLFQGCGPVDGPNETGSSISSITSCHNTGKTLGIETQVQIQMAC